MVSYKTLRRITVGGIQAIMKNTDLPKVLTEQTQGSSTADAMQYRSAVYQVSTGKEYVMLGVIIWTDGTGGGTVAIYEAATEDAITSLKRTIDVPFIPLGMALEQMESGAFAAGKFITIVPSTTTVLHFQIIGYERDV